MCFWSESGLGVRLRRAGSHGKTFPRDPARLNLTSNLFSPRKHINSYWVRVCKKPTSSWRSSLKNVDGRNNSQQCWELLRPCWQKYTNGSNYPQQCWSYYLKINSTRHQHDTQRGIVAVESCFAVFVAHQGGVTDGESVCYAVLMSHKPALFWCFFGVVLMSCKINQLCRIQCVYFVYFCWSGQVIFVSPQSIST